MDSLEKEIKDAYWGHIIFNDDSTITHKVRSSNNSFLKALGSLAGALANKRRIHRQSRDSLPYSAMITWYQNSEDELILHGLITRIGSPIKNSMALYRELEEVAKIKGQDYIYACTIKNDFTKKQIPRKIMKFLGWECIGEYLNTGAIQYKKEVIF